MLLGEMFFINLNDIPTSRQISNNIFVQFNHYFYINKHVFLPFSHKLRNFTFYELVLLINFVTYFLIANITTLIYK